MTIDALIEASRPSAIVTSASAVHVTSRWLADTLSRERPGVEGGLVLDLLVGEARERAGAFGDLPGKPEVLLHAPPRAIPRQRARKRRRSLTSVVLEAVEMTTLKSGPA